MAKRPNENTENTETQETQQSQSSSGSMPAYLQAAARISTSYPLGAQSTDDVSKWTALPQFDTVVEAQPVPGYIVLDYVPTLGVSTSPTSALNRAAFNSFNAIRSQISGNRPYEPADLEIARAAITSMHDLYYYVRRIYGVIRKYSATNLYRPRMALTAMGLNADDWIQNAAQLYQWLLDHRAAMAPFPTVKIGDITDRHHAFNTFMFTDGSIDSVQTYIFNQKAFWSYEVVDEVKGLTPRAFPSTYAAFLQMWDEMYTALQSSSDIYIMCADIRRAFGDSVVTELPDTTSDYVVEYIELDPIKMSIMNALIIGKDIIDVSESENPYNEFRITDQSGVLYCKPTFILNDLTFGSDGVKYVSVPTNHINSVMAEPGPAEIIESLRLKPVVRIGENSTTPGVVRYTIEAMGTEVVVDAHIVGFSRTGSSYSSRISSLIVARGTTNDSSGYRSAYYMYKRAITSISGLVNFDWHPPVSTVLIDTSETSNEILPFEDIQNYIPVSDNAISMIHEANLLAQFGV